MVTDQRMQIVAGRVQALVDEFAASPDPAVREKTQELVRLLMELYGSGLGHIVRILQQGDDAWSGAIEAVLRDELVASLLVLHDLHPQEPEVRIAGALERVRSVAGVEVVLLAASDGSVRIRVLEQHKGGPPGAPELRSSIEGAVYAAAPDTVHIEIEGLPETATPLVQLTAKPPAGRKDAS